MTKLMYEVEGLLEAELIDPHRLKVIADSLDQKLKLVKSPDEEVLETCNMEEIKKEIEDSDKINSCVMNMLQKVNDAMSLKQNNQGILALTGKKDKENTTSIPLQSTGPITVVPASKCVFNLEMTKIFKSLEPLCRQLECNCHVSSNNQAGNMQEPHSIEIQRRYYAMAELLG